MTAPRAASLASQPGSTRSRAAWRVAAHDIPQPGECASLEPRAAARSLASVADVAQPGEHAASIAQHLAAAAAGLAAAAAAQLAAAHEHADGSPAHQYHLGKATGLRLASHALTDLQERTKS